MTGKMLPGRHHSVLLYAPDESRTELGDHCRIFTKRTRIDDGIGWVVVDVQHRRICDVDAEGASFQGCDAAHLVGERRISGCSKRHLRREDRGASQIDAVRNEVPASGSMSG